MPASAMVTLPRVGMNFAKRSADGPTRTNMVSVSRTQVSGDSDSLHKNPSTRRPWARPSQYQLLSAMTDPATAAAMIVARLSSPRAVSAPATASSGEAGIGSPPSSSCTVKKTASRPNCSISLTTSSIGWRPSAGSGPEMLQLIPVPDDSNPDREGK